MTDPLRLIDELGPGLERDLLSASESERAPSALRDRVVLGMAAATALGPVVATAHAAGSGSAASSGSLLASALKWLSIGAVAGGFSGAIGVAVTAERPPPARAVEPAPEPTPAPPARVTQPKKSVVAATAEPPSKPAPRRQPREGDVRIGSTALSTEAASLARIRILSRRDPRRALTELDHHEARYSAHGVLAADARALRAEIDRGIRSRSPGHESGKEIQ